VERLGNDARLHERELQTTRLCVSSSAGSAHETIPVSTNARQGFVRRCIFITDHKTVGLQYFFLALAAVTIAILLSLLMRFHLVWPQAYLPFIAGGIMTPEQYLALVTMHGTLMVFFVLTVAPQSLPLA
jgi:cytochrome c oxidase subunit I